MDYTESLYADGFSPILIVSIKIEGSKIIRRAIIAPEYAECLHLVPELATAIRTAVEDVLELGKPLDDRRLRPGITVEMRE